MPDGVDFADVRGQDVLITYIVAAVAEGHNILMITERPFRSPHHNASTNALVGGGSPVVPGEISLAHNGVLFLDEIAEFDKKSLDALRQPMEDKIVTVSRVRSTESFPANFMLVAAMNPCPCGYYGQSRCRCTDYEVELYWLWLSEQRGIGPVTLRKLVRAFGSPQGVYEASPRDLEVSGLRSGLARSFALNRSLERVNQIEEAMKRQNVHLLTFMDPAYPQHLNKVSNLPALLYYNLLNDRLFDTIREIL